MMANWFTRRGAASLDAMADAPQARRPVSRRPPPAQAVKDFSPARGFFGAVAAPSTPRPSYVLKGPIESEPQAAGIMHFLSNQNFAINKISERTLLPTI